MALDTGDRFGAVSAAILSEVIGVIELDLTELRFLRQNDCLRWFLSTLGGNARIDPWTNLRPTESKR